MEMAQASGIKVTQPATARKMIDPPHRGKGIKWFAVINTYRRSIRKAVIEVKKSITDKVVQFRRRCEQNVFKIQHGNPHLF